MSSNIPVRRPAKTVRTTVKDIENATARAARISQRTKALAEGDLKPVAPKKPAEAGSDSAVGKRKRGVLAEVGGPNAHRDAGCKGKEKEQDGGSKLKPIITKPIARRPLQTTAGGRIPPTGGAASKTAVAGRRRFIVAQEDASESSVAPTIRRPLSISEQTIASTSRSRSNSVVDDDEPLRVFKKRHTAAAPDVPLSAIAEVEPLSLNESQLEIDDIAAQLAPVQEEDRDWIDLDADDADDPLSASEYIAEICEYMKQVELNTLPASDYMDRQVDLDWPKRGILLDWMLQIHSMYRCFPETWFLFVNIFDRFLSMRATVSVSKLQLVGISCFFIATKFEESTTPSVQDIANLTGEQYKIADILKAEQYVLRTINWDLSYCGPMSWLRRGSKADDLDPVARTIAKYLLEVASLDWRLVAIPSSLQSAASLYLARLALSRDDWTPTLVRFAGYREDDLLPVARLIIEHLLLPEDQQSSTLIKKYASKRFLKCSVHMREWALYHFSKGASNLETDLPDLKRRIREERQMREQEEREERRLR